ncbi:tyrosine-protein phosphatase [Sulfuritalea sp.]|uniref:tyrosine-protein phosphatase n=1 Tax=Sulfuritalea sp. TaxID=2480090 RepID=UPI00286E23CF|nr:CpsB/CapC family capsule biosynthesis tyrosine phosphatase [Sulfuritalea sp.]
MIDLHCHILPGIDDGPEDLASSLQLARHAVASGIRVSVVTPHMHSGRYENQASNIRSAAQQFQRTLDAEGIALQILCAAEVRLDHEILSWVADGHVPFLGEWQGERVMLLEFPHSHVPVGADKLVEWLLKQGIRPMIAHPERNKDIMRSIDKLLPFIRLGCLLQLTAGAVAGAFGEGARARAVDLLGKGWVTVLASDAHNLEARPPELEPGRIAAAAIVGEDESWNLVRHRPARITGLKAD